MTNKEAIKVLTTEDCQECTFNGYGNGCTLTGCKVHQALDMAIKALELADEVEEASKKIGMRYYGPDICANCAHATPSTDHSTTTAFCEHYGLKVNDFDHCEHYKER